VKISSKSEKVKSNSFSGAIDLRWSFLNQERNFMGQVISQAFKPAQMSLRNRDAEA
jgi:hypothetical protein